MKTAIDNTASGFLTERRDFLHIAVVKSVSNEGWDIVCRMDGTYFDKVTAQAAADELRTRMEELVDVPMEGRKWWAGPPWK
jgi:hypothetical protein